MRAGFVFLIFVTQTTFAQFNYVFDKSIPVTLQNDEVLTMPWAGGLNATQFNTIDLNGDGRDDLAIFDRTAEKVVTFINDNNQYRHAPEFEIFFPQEITNWMLLRDYNGDGKKDIFTSDIFGIRVYTNTTLMIGQISFEHLRFFSGVAGSQKTQHLLSAKADEIEGTIKTGVQLNSDDLPAISDADGDGDLDLFVPYWPNGAYTVLHKNLSVERYGTLDSLDFEYTFTATGPEVWGGVRECDCGVFAFNGDPCNMGGRVEHAGGKSLFAFDVDNDGDQDMLISESECSQLFLLLNEGTNAAPVVNGASPFPPISPAAMVSYPTAFYEDVDFDGVKDLIATPNIFAREFLSTNLRQSVWFYKNTGTTALPSFSVPNRSFLQQNMIDIGDNAVPAFFDADGDSDLDLFVGCYSFGFSGSIFYFENTGTQSLPGYKLITPDFFNISFLNIANIKPSFADMNGDAKLDLVFTASNQYGGNTQLYYFPNNSGTVANFSQTLVTVNFATVTDALTSYDNVHVTDVNMDGKNDLLVGKRNGRLQYWRNVGTAINPNYALEDDSYLELGSSVLRQSPACTTADLNADGEADLILGDQTGRILIIPNYRDAANVTGGISTIIYNPVAEGYVSQNLGGRIWPSVANIFKSDKPAIIVGNTLGGMHILKHDESTQLPENPTIDVYPNPVTKETSILNIKVDRSAGLMIISLLGQPVISPVFLQPFQEYGFQLHGFSRGIYILYFVIDGKIHTRKIVIN
jgi:hypothetical protein